MEVKRKTNKSTATKKVDVKEKPLWKKITGGFLRLRKGGRRVKPNEKIRATREELGTFIKQFELLSDVASDREAYAKSQIKKAKEEEVQGEGTGPFEAKHAGSGWYNVYSSEGKKMNEKKLQGKAATDAFIKSLGE